VREEDALIENRRKAVEQIAPAIPATIEARRDKQIRATPNSRFALSLLRACFGQMPNLTPAPIVFMGRVGGPRDFVLRGVILNML